MCHTCMYGISINLWGLNTDVFIKTMEKEISNCKLYIKIFLPERAKSV